MSERNDEDAMPLSGVPIEETEERVELGRFAYAVRGVHGDEARIAAHLA